MTDYEKAMLKLKLLELTQRQTMLAIQAYDSKGSNAVAIAQEGKRQLDEATASVGKLL